MAAAVVVPLELLVFRKSSPKTAAATATAIQRCESSSTAACQNGGTTILTNGNCACDCISGFTGSACQIASTTGCSADTLPGYSNVQLGDAIVRLITGAGNFSIPLSGETILARFKANNLSCVSENALVTFDGSSQTSGKENDAVAPPSSGSSAPTPTHNGKAKRESTSAPTPSPTDTSIVYSTSHSYTPTSSSNPSSTASTTNPPSASASATLNPNSTFQITQQTLDFARVVTLFILQEQTLDSAVAAQNSIQMFLSMGFGGQTAGTVTAARNLTLGSGSMLNSVDLVAFRVDVGAGVVGGLNASVTKR